MTALWIDFCVIRIRNRKLNKPDGEIPFSTVYVIIHVPKYRHWNLKLNVLGYG